MNGIIGDLLTLNFLTLIFLLALTVSTKLFLFFLVTIISFGVLWFGWSTTYLVWKDELTEVKR